MERWRLEMAKKPETLEQRMAADPDLAEVLGGFKEEMLASIRRRKPKAEVLEFPPKLEEQELFRRKQVLEQDKERLEAQIDAQRSAIGLPSLETARQIRKGLEVARASEGRVLSNHDPVKLFEDEIAKEKGDD
jgi:hypothetical protein